ncbi:MAG TPA: hypothetical protein VN512_00950 [Clostridia bacterium]|nr:hypothetical protein [Clostridia bacterium]
MTQFSNELSVTISYGLAQSVRISEQPSTLEKLIVLRKAKQRGIKTNILYAPVFERDFVYGHISTNDWCDSIVIGLPVNPRQDIDWAEFGHMCEYLCKKYGRSYEISRALRDKMA